MLDLDKVTHIIFDWDGTIMDSADKIVSCMQKAAQLSDLPIPTNNEVKHIIGISLLPAIKQLFSIGNAKAEQVCEHYKEVFLMQDKTASPLFDGAHGLLSLLSQNYSLGVATGKARRGLERAFLHSNSARYFEHSICADEAESKPSPDMLKQLMKRWNIESSQAVMIGDTVYDMQMAEEICMPRIAVSYGVHKTEDLMKHQPLAVVDSLNDLRSIFKTTKQDQ